MTVQTRKHRGYKTQSLVAQWFADRGWPYAESTGASRQGADITGTPDVAIEVKARAGFNPLAWVRQAVAAADGRLPFVVFRCNGQGETTMGDWPCLIRLSDLTALLHEAGYGDPPPVNVVPGSLPAPQRTPCPSCAEPVGVDSAHFDGTDYLCGAVA